jgi:hypothetical protein
VATRWRLLHNYFLILSHWYLVYSFHVQDLIHIIKFEHNSTYLTYGADPFLRSCQLCSHSRTSQHFMEPEGSLWCSQELSTAPYPEPDRSSPLLRSFIQEICPGPRLLMSFRNKLTFYGEDRSAPRPTPKLEGHPLSAVRDCLCIYIRSYPSYMEAVSSISNLGTRHAVVTREHTSIIIFIYSILTHTSNLEMSSSKVFS